MWDFHGYRISIFGVLMFGILQGLCAVSADTNTEKVLKVGSSLDLTVTYPKNSVSFVQWNFNGKTFADYTPSLNYTLRGSQFSGRLKGVLDLIGVTLQDLQPQDSGTFSIVALGVTQYPTQIIKVYIQTDTDTEKVLKVGSSLDLTVTYPKNSVSFVQWNFNGKTFADYTPSLNYTLRGSQFSGRLKGVLDLIGVTLQDLQPQDSGTFSIVAVGVTQYPTQIIKVYIQSPIRVVQIERTQRWLLSTNSCEVDMKCAAHGAENVSYLWSGYKIANGAQLQFNLSPAEGAITLNCTAANNISSSSATETLSCSTEPPETEIPLPVLKLTSSLVAASPYLLVTIILVIKCYRVQDPIRAVQIERTQRWLLSTNSCEVDVKCAAHGAENVSYLWSGYKIANGAQLQFNLSPAEGAITLNCTAANNISSSFITETLSCSTEQPKTDETGHHSRQYAVTVIEE
ncbi:hypothetical protein QTP86_007810 [Hemibagrus guttatus]|nr:hypothetical protein QTP86_007810 [Hemibagrus guttatus]